MKTTIKTTGTTLTKDIETYIETKVRGIEKLLKDQDAVEIRFEVGKPSKHHRKGDVFYAEANLRLGGKLLRATDENWDMRVAIDNVKHKLEKQLADFKDKMLTKDHKGLPKK